MATLTIRGLDDNVKRQLMQQAKLHGRSMEEEARVVLARGTAIPNIGLALLQAAQSVTVPGELLLPARDDEARVVDFG